jgi:homoserine acetyltransferase
MRRYPQHAEDGQRAGTYVALTAAMNSHAIGRGRGRPHAALRGLRAEPTVIGR